MIKLVVFDVDGTLATPPSIWERIYYEIGKWETEGEKHLKAYLRGEISFDKFARLDAKAFAGNKEKMIYEAAEKMEYIRNMEPFMALVRKRQIQTAIISCTIFQFAKLIQERWEIDYCFANPLKVDKRGVLNGGIDLAVGEKAKGKVLKYLQEKLQISKDETVVIGDSMIDLDMFERAKHNASFLASPEKLQRESTVILEGHDLQPLIDYINFVDSIQ